MHIFFLDLASHSGRPSEGACMACVSDTKTEAVRFIDHRITDKELIPEFSALLKETKWNEKDISHIACVTGPGGFTSLRMAVTMANVLADQLQIPLAGIHLSDVYEARVGSYELRATRKLPLITQNSKLNFLWLHATKRDSLFIRGFGTYKKKWPEATLLNLDDLLQEIPEGATIAGEVLPEQRAQLLQKNLREMPLLPLSDALPKLLTDLSYEKKPLEPWYGRGW